MDKILLIVDPQVDFISGSLAVEGAKEKMDALASALQNGGQWPPHCVKGTAGSCVYAVEKSMYVPSYSKGIPTYDVLMELKSQMPNNELVIITTPETYSEIPLWHNGSTILKNYKFIMVINGEEPPYGLPDNVSLVYVPTIRMCSTCIRNRVKDGVGIKPFVRDDVYEIIKQYKLYV